MLFSDKLISWYKKHYRRLPWRETNDPFKIWLSEVILQQTRVQQGMAYYQRFTSRFENVQALAGASEDEVLRLWQGLGYYSRARNLHKAARVVANEHGGAFPNTHAALLKLPGIGDYTASAIASIAFNQPTAVVDGNVYRLLARHFGIATPIDSSEGRKEFKALATQLMDTDHPGTFNQAMMELGAKVCKPQSPLCTACPLLETCVAARKGKVSEYPVKVRKPTIRNRYFHYLVLTHADHWIIHKRTKKDIWHNMYDFPLLETTKSLSVAKLSLTDTWASLTKLGPKFQPLVSPSIKHVLTHQHISARFAAWAITKKELAQIPSAWIAVRSQELYQYALPRLIEKYVTQYEGQMPHRKP